MSDLDAMMPTERPGHHIHTQQLNDWFTYLRCECGVFRSTVDTTRIDVECRLHWLAVDITEEALAETFSTTWPT